MSVFNKPSKVEVFEQPDESGLDVLEFTEEEQFLALKKTNSGNGRNSSPGKLLQCLANELWPHVTVSLNYILKTVIFPKHWKQPNVTPL